MKAPLAVAHEIALYWHSVHAWRDARPTEQSFSDCKHPGCQNARRALMEARN